MLLTIANLIARLKSFDVKSIDFHPKILTTIKTYNKATFMSDLMAGIIVGIVALPLAIAFAISSGVAPEKGIITAIIAGFIISLLGGSKVQIGGPTGAFIIIIYGIVSNPEYGIMGLTIATILAGVLLLLLGLFRLGTIIKFIPYPIIVGFTSGIALTIFTTQMADLFGLNTEGETIPADFVGKWIMYFKYIQTINPLNLVIGLFSILIIVKTPKYTKTIPGSLVSIVLITVVVHCLKEYLGIIGLDTIGDRFTIKAAIPDAEVPTITWVALKKLLPVAITIALLGAIESLLSAAVADGVINDRHNSNTELIAQGVANMVTPLFGGIPATGAIARTMTNIENGGKTPIAGIIHAVVLLIILLVLMPLAQYIPMACLAGVLIVVAYNMSEWRTFKTLLSNPKGDVAVLIITFLLTVIFDLTIAIEVGIVIACLFFMKRVAETSDISVITGDTDQEADGFDDEKLDVPEGVEIFEINGPYFFGIANKFEEQMINLHKRSRVRIIRMRRVPFIDSTGIKNLTNFCKTSKNMNVAIVLSGVNKEVREDLKKSGFYDFIGKENICSNISSALYRSDEIIAAQKQEEEKQKLDESGSLKDS